MTFASFVSGDEVEEERLRVNKMSAGEKREFILSKIRPPEEIREKLAPLSGLCTRELLENIRYGRYQKVEWDQNKVPADMTEWFSSLRKTTSEWNHKERNKEEGVNDSLLCENMMFHQWGCMGDELIALDKATRVPRDSPEVQDIYRAIRSLPEWVAAQVEQKIPAAKLRISPIGSFPCDTKVMDVNEFDFLLIYDHDLMRDALYTDCTFLHGQDAFLFNSNGVFERASKEGSKIVERLGPLSIPFQVTKDMYTSQMSIVGCNKHGPATCLTLGWKCKHGHNHEIDIDITFGKAELNRSIKKLGKGLAEAPAFRHVYDNISDKEPPIFIPGFEMYSPCSIEERLHTAMVDISPNTLVAYRCLKVLLSHALPSRIYEQPFCPEGHTLASCASSHKIKQVLMAQVNKYNKAEHWKTENLHLRMAEILDDLKIDQIDMRDAIVVMPTDIDYGQSPSSSMAKNFQQRLDRNIIKTALGDHKDHVDMLSRLIKYAYEERAQEGQTLAHHENVSTLEIPQRFQYFVVDKDCMHLITSDPNKLCIVGHFCNSTQVLVYRTSQSSMLFSTHPLIQWCRTMIHDKYKDNKGIDFSRVSTEAFDHVWTLFKGDIIKQSDFTDGISYMFKTIAFHELYLKVFGFEADGMEKTLMVVNSLLGLTQIKLTEEIVKDDVLVMNTTPLWDPISLIEKSLPQLHKYNRAFILLWCRQVIREKDLIIGQADLWLIEDTEDGSNDIHRHNIIKSVEYIMVMLRRYGGGKYGGDNMLGQSLLFLVIKHLLVHDMDYFRELEQKHLIWAKLFTEKLIQRKDLPIDLAEAMNRQSSFSYYNMRDKAESLPWVSIRAELFGDRDYDYRMNLYRCLAAHGIGECMRAPRSGLGLMLHLTDALTEGMYAHYLQSDVTGCCYEHRDLIKQYQHDDDKEERLYGVWDITDGYTPYGYKGYVRFAAIAYLCKVQVHLYTERNGEYERLAIIPEPFYQQRAPIALLWTPGILGIPGRYSLLIKNNHLLCSDLWKTRDLAKGIFDPCAAGASNADKDVTFESLLQPPLPNKYSEILQTYQGNIKLKQVLEIL